MDKINIYSTASAQRIERIQELLRGQALTLQEIADAINISRRYARDYINYLQEVGSVYIADFRKGYLPGNCRHYLALYRWNAASVTEADDGEQIDRVQAQKKAKSIKPFRDWTAAWIPTR
jgi:biotin operon repressor